MNKNRDNTLEEVLNIYTKHKDILLELPVGYGKTKLAIELSKNINLIDRCMDILIVIPRVVLKDNWNKELDKWKAKSENRNYRFITYKSFLNRDLIGNPHIIIFDECHHLSDRCLDVLSSLNTQSNIFLSATVKDSLKQTLFNMFDNLYCYTISRQEATENEVLPEPKIILYPLNLKTGLPTETIIKNPKAKGKAIECSWANRWNFIKQKQHPIKIYCTEQQYIKDLNGQIEWLKKRSLRSKAFKNKWLHLCGDRLKWLSEKKEPIIKSLLGYLNEERTLTFCNNINQTEELGKYCINSKNKESIKYLEEFNTHKINHITACNMLNEGMNLVDCKIGIYANLNSSETIVEQRLGRLLRHKEPIIIIPYYKNTREEELVNMMIQGYDSKLITKIKNIEEIKI